MRLVPTHKWEALGVHIVWDVFNILVVLCWPYDQINAFELGLLSLNIHSKTLACRVNRMGGLTHYNIAYDYWKLA